MHLAELIPSNPHDQGGKVEHGKGLIPSVPSDKDFSLHQRLVDDGYLPEVLGAEEMLATFPTSFVVPNLPPITNQGLTPQCVAYSEGMMKAWQDHIDQGQWFDFNENSFFYAIGGGPSGAVAKYGLDYLLSTGYPLQTNAAAAGQHKINAYFRSTLAHADLKAALMAYGPLVVGMKWSESWSHPYSNGVVPPPSGVANGHLILLVGWVDGMGFLFQNSWGTNWGVNGRCYIPARYLSDADGTKQAAFEAWKTLDQIIPSVIYCTVKAGARIRASASGTGTLIATLSTATKLVYKGTVAGGSYNYWDGTKWTVRNDWAKVVYNGIDRYVVRVNAVL